MPSHPVAQTIARGVRRAGGSGIAAPSANRFGHVSPTTAQHVADDLGDAVAMIVDGGACDVGIESTIVAFTGGEPMLLRPGGIGVDELARVLGAAPRAPDASAPRASGTLASHYAPHAPARFVAARCAAAGDWRMQLARRARRGPGADVARPADFTGRVDRGARPSAGYAHDLYANLRALDAPGVTAILVEDVPDDDAWLAVRDRLSRRAGDTTT